MPTTAELEQQIRVLEAQLAQCRHDRDLLAAKFIKVEQLLFTLPTAVPRRSSGEPYDYIDSRRHLIQELKAAII